MVGEDDVKVKILAAPINPSDINSIQGRVSLCTSVIWHSRLLFAKGSTTPDYLCLYNINR